MGDDLNGGNKMFLYWFLLIWSILSLNTSIYSYSWYKKLNNELKYGDPYKVSFAEYLISAYGCYLGIPASSFGVIGSIYLLYITYLRS